MGTGATQRNKVSQLKPEQSWNIYLVSNGFLLKGLRLEEFRFFSLRLNFLVEIRKFLKGLV